VKLFKEISKEKKKHVGIFARQPALFYFQDESQISKAQIKKIY
jgi:hypothetical protein